MIKLLDNLKKFNNLFAFHSISFILAEKFEKNTFLVLYKIHISLMFWIDKFR